MKPKVKLIIMSHLSDVQEGVQYEEIDYKGIRQKINFVKWLILKYSDTEIEIDPNKEWEDFLKEKNEN